MHSNSLVELVKEALLDEVFSSVVYSRLANLHRKEPLKSKLSKIADVERRRAKFWSEFLRRRGYKEVFVKVNELKLFLYLAAFRVIGLGLTLRVLEMSERDAVELYQKCWRTLN